MLGQDDNERIMGARLADWGLRGMEHRLVALQQNEACATATLKQPDGATQRSPPRGSAAATRQERGARATGIAFPGAPYEHVFFVADTEVTGSMVPDEVNVYLWRAGFHLFFPMRGQDHWRIVGILPTELRDRNDVAFDDVVPSMRAEAGAGLAFKTCTWFPRIASRIGPPSIFVAAVASTGRRGDSQSGRRAGMNTGLQDGYNLAWKLALVVAGRGEPRLVDSYEDERLPVARRLLNTTDQDFGSSSPTIRWRVAARDCSRGSARSRCGARRSEARVSHCFADRHPLP